MDSVEARRQEWLRKSPQEVEKGVLMAVANNRLEGSQECPRVIRTCVEPQTLVDHHTAGIKFESVQSTTETQIKGVSHIDGELVSQTCQLVPWILCVPFADQMLSIQNQVVKLSSYVNSIGMTCM
jgi:hypothetical protein